MQTTRVALAVLVEETGHDTVHVSRSALEAAVVSPDDAKIAVNKVRVSILFDRTPYPVRRPIFMP